MEIFVSTAPTPQSALSVWIPIPFLTVSASPVLQTAASARSSTALPLAMNVFLHFSSTMDNVKSVPHYAWNAHQTPLAPNVLQKTCISILPWVGANCAN